MTVTYDRCEHRFAGASCIARARYRVSRNGRYYDAQDSCGRHLAATVDALSEGQQRDIIVRLKQGSALAEEAGR